MNGKNVLVTGGASGLGRSVCLLLAEAGAGVVVADIDAVAGRAVAAEISAAGGRATSLVGDITLRASAYALFQSAVADVGAIHGLVNCAGIYPRRPILEIGDADWDASFAVNVRGLSHMTSAAVEHMRAIGGGRIVNVSSIDAFKAHPANAHYAAMKAAVVSLTKSFGEAFAADGILVNGVAPAAIATEKAKAAGFLGEFAAKTPIGRAADPSDVAEVILFLVSERNRYMVGETIAISGGYFIP
ncbi:SDR family oxidoreductase [Siculibacillus lacustris]|uniref:SDR family oxidoreductase n=1 Tax=Siculibacillus lacustris TaxID=1549641 RepID=A0A4Q9VK76_9HYPH|nr:SDR family NAD(P)-dependent oxidoreductase [Siculibacillus lacustris]TBW35539.1 SDR family oxidoreductase [Siculibacillus lacustris]